MAGRRRGSFPSSLLSGVVFLLDIINIGVTSEQSVSVFESCEIQGSKYSKENNRWDEYLENIREAKANCVPCSFVDSCSSCHFSVIEEDLKPFEGGITEEQLNGAWKEGARLTKYQIIGGKVYRSEECMFPTRCEGIEHFLREVAPSLPDTEFIVNTRDWPQVNSWGNQNDVPPIFSFSKVRSSHSDIMYPAWAFWSGGPAISLHPRGLGRWDLMRKQLLASSQEFPWDNKTDTAFFRGSRTSKERDPLVRLSRACPSVVDAQFTKNQAWKSEADTLGLPPAPEVSLSHHCKHKFLFNYRGVAASFRLKHLFLCGSTVLHVGEEWLEFWYPSLVPWYHYIPVPSSASQSQLLAILEFLSHHRDLAQEIAENGKHFVVSHLRMEDVSCYWAQLLTQYTKLLKYNVIKDPKCSLQI